MSEAIAGELISTGGEAQVIVDTATRAAGPSNLDSGGSLVGVVVPAGGRLEVVDVVDRLDRYNDQPRRKSGQVSVVDPASLSAYVNRHTGEAAQLYADWRQRRVVAVLNDHQGDGPGWGDHRAVLTLSATPEWQKWTGKNEQWLSQEEFAEHILDTTRDVVSPSAADLMEMAETFQANRSVQFRSGSRLKDGQRQLTYVEVIEAQAGAAGDVTIPDSILLRLAPFDGAEPVEMVARTRYRINEGRLKLGYVLDRPDLVLREACVLVVAGISEATGIEALWGTPRS